MATAGGVAIIGASLPEMQVALSLEGSPFHAVYGVNGEWVHAYGNLGGRMFTTRYRAQYYALRAWKTLTGIPVRNAEAVLMEGRKASSCVTAAFHAFLRGWGLPW